MNTYTIVHANGSSDTVKGCKLAVKEETGQTIIYINDGVCTLNNIVAVVPATSFVKLTDKPKGE